MLMIDREQREQTPPGKNIQWYSYFFKSYYNMSTNTLHNTIFNEIQVYCSVLFWQCLHEKCKINQELVLKYLHNVWVALHLRVCAHRERAGWQNLAAFRRGQKWPWKFPWSTYLQFSRQMRRFCANSQIYSKVCNIYHVIVHFLPKKHCFWPKRHFFCPKISKKCENRDKY